MADIATLPPGQEQFAELLAWMGRAHPGPVSVLDVGGGGGFYDFPASLRPRATRMVGVDPDAGVLSRPWFDEAHRETVESYAMHTGETFDVALCVYVLEHVETPAAFLRSIRGLLRPGGSCFGVTPNLLHYFGLLSAAAGRLGVEDWLLHRVRPHELIEAYHSPVRYRLNTVRALRSAAAGAGFRRVEIRALEQAGMFETYFPPRLRWWPRAYSRIVNRLGRPVLFGTLLFRLQT